MGMINIKYNLKASNCHVASRLLTDLQTELQFEKVHSQEITKQEDKKNRLHANYLLHSLHQSPKAITAKNNTQSLNYKNFKIGQMKPK